MISLITLPPASSEGWANFEEIRAAMTSGSIGPELERIRVNARYLAGNSVLTIDREKSSCQLVSPIFGYWLRSTSKNDVLSGRNAEADRLLEVARSALEAGELDQAYVAVTRCLEEYRSEADVQQLAADIAEKRGDFDDALAHLKEAAQLLPSAAQTLVGFLKRRIMLADGEQHPVESWNQELRAISKEDAQEEAVQKSRLLHSWQRWLASFHKGDGAAFEFAFDVVLDILAERPEFLVEYRQRLLDDLTLLATEQLVSVGNERRGLRFLKSCFAPFTQRFDKSFREDAELSLLRDFADDEKALEKIRARYATLRSAPWWDSAVGVLDQSLAKQTAWRENFQELAPVLQHFAQFAPSGCRGKVTRCFETHLPILLSSLIGADWNAAAQLLVLLCDMPGTPHDQIWVAFEEHATTLEGGVNPADDLLIIEYIRAMPALYQTWFGKEPRHLIDDISKQLKVFIKRFRTEKREGRVDPDSWALFAGAGQAYREWVRLLQHPLLRECQEAKGSSAESHRPQKSLDGLEWAFCRVERRTRGRRFGTCSLNAIPSSGLLTTGPSFEHQIIYARSRPSGMAKSSVSKCFCSRKRTCGESQPVICWSTFGTMSGEHSRI